ncbi:MAG: hypothetical protein D6767_05645, partial [Candidatus Hydrogenedentota bacterium]
MKKIISVFLAFSFSIFGIEINVYKSFLPGEKPKIDISSVPYKSLHLRIYRIADPVQFLKGQTNAHEVKVKAKRRSSGGYAMLASFKENITRAFFESARNYMRESSRVRLRELLGLKPYQFPYEDRYPDRALFKPLSYPLVKEIHIGREENEYWTSSYELSKLAAGFYLLEASQGNHIAFAPFLVSAVVLGVHESPKKALI